MPCNGSRVSRRARPVFIRGLQYLCYSTVLIGSFADTSTAINIYNLLSSHLVVNIAVPFLSRSRISRNSLAGSIAAIGCKSRLSTKPVSASLAPSPLTFCYLC